MSQDPFQEREAEKYANPIPSREFILEHLTKREKPASRDELAIELNIEGEEQIEALRRRLRAMERDGQLVFTRRQCYALPERLDLVKGIVIGHRDGYGFLRVEGRKDDLYLSSEQMKMCIHGDQVLAQPLGELCQTPVPAPALIAALAQQLFRERTGQIFFQLCRTVEINQRLFLREPQRDGTDALGPQAAVQLPNRIQQFLPAGIGTAEEIPGLQARQCGGTVAHKQFLRHGDFPYAG